MHDQDFIARSLTHEVYVKKSVEIGVIIYKHAALMTHIQIPDCILTEIKKTMSIYMCVVVFLNF